MHDVFQLNSSEAVLMVDAENAFNSINRKALLHKIRYICPEISTFIYNCYNVPARLFIIGGQEIISKEGTTQGDPTAMATYTLGLVPLITSMLNMDNNIKLVAFADDLTGTGSIKHLHEWWAKLIDIGPKYGYYPKSSKSYVVVKEEQLEEAKNMFSGTCVNVTSAGKRHLGAVIGSQQYKDEYVNELVTRWTKELKVLSQIAEIQPQAAYSAYVHGFRGKFTYFLRTIPDISYCLQPVEDIIRNEFIPAITGGNQCSDKERDLLALPVRLGGLGLENITKISTREYESSRKMTKSLVESVIEQQIIFEVHEEEQKKLKAEIKKDRREYHQQNLDELRQSMK